MIDLFADDLDKPTNSELFSAIEDFAKAQPNEGFRLDYKERWSDSTLQDVAAFANTHGGLLLIGVAKDKRDIEPRVVGVESDTEYKTRIASSIASRISPIPSYQIFECHKPSEPKKKFCIVRVASGTFVHLIMMAGIAPIYVRNEDESRPADASQVRRLIEREKNSRL